MSLLEIDGRCERDGIAIGADDGQVRCSGGDSIEPRATVVLEAKRFRITRLETLQVRRDIDGHLTRSSIEYYRHSLSMLDFEQATMENIKRL